MNMVMRELSDLVEKIKTQEVAFRLNGSEMVKVMAVASHRDHIFPSSKWAQSGKMKERQSRKLSSFRSAWKVALRLNLLLNQLHLTVEKMMLLSEYAVRLHTSGSLVKLGMVIARVEHAPHPRLRLRRRTLVQRLQHRSLLPFLLL